MGAASSFPGLPKACRSLPAVLLALAATLSSLAEDTVDLRVEAVGAFNAFRPGDVTGLRVQARSRLEQPVECLLQWELSNADGDLVTHTRQVTLAPGQPASRWLYARLPPVAPSELSDEVFTVRAFELQDGRRQRELGVVRFRTADAGQRSMPVGLREGLVGVIGDGRVGLEPLEATFEGASIPSMAEVTRIARLPRPGDLPDRWEGLASLETLVWSGTTGPQGVAADRLEAVQRWVRRGGHLVIVPPESGDVWGLRSGSHGLSALLPSKGGRTAEGIRVADMLPMLGKVRDLRRPDARMPVTVFEPASLDRGWRPLLWMPDSADAATRGVRGQTWAIQRSLGAGRITLIGLDLDALNRQSLAVTGLPEADVFWNRVLGRRADAPREEDYRSWMEAKPRRLVSGPGVMVDAAKADFIRAELTVGSRSGSRILVTIVFLAAYVMLAVPLPWLALKRRGLLRWSWPAFAGVAAAASLLSLAAARAVGGPEVPVRHLSVVDVIDDGTGRNTIRGTGWMSVALGGFGTASVRLGSDGGDDLLMDWWPPGRDSSRFPDSARGNRAVDAPDRVEVPARGTTTELQGWWLAAAPESWGRVIEEDPARPVRGVTTTGASPRMGLEGRLRHALPAPLRDVTIVHVGPFTWTPRERRDSDGGQITPSSLPPRPARIATLPEWDGKPLELGPLLYPSGSVLEASKPVHPGTMDAQSLVVALDEKYRDPMTGLLQTTLGLQTDAVPGTRSPQDNLRMLSMFQMLPPPQYRRAAAQTTGSARIVRSLGRELDLSPALSQPCVIVTGFLDEQPLPVRIEVDGEPQESLGRTMVRWVLPLPAESAGDVTPLGGRAVP